jgi:hypothetical protein
MKVAVLARCLCESAWSIFRMLFTHQNQIGVRLGRVQRLQRVVAGGRVLHTAHCLATRRLWATSQSRFRWPVFMYLRGGWKHPFCYTLFRLFYDDAADRGP